MDGESGESTEDNDVIDAAGPDLRGGANLLPKET